jgi:hypothetical protein
MCHEGWTWDEALTFIRERRDIANPNIRFEIPLRLAAGERLTDAWISKRIASYLQKMLEDFNVEIDPQEIARNLADQGTTALLHAS